MSFGNPPRTPWRAFPDVFIHAEESAVKRHPEYSAAKSGGVPAARRLVEAMLREEIVAALPTRRNYDSPTKRCVRYGANMGTNLKSGGKKASDTTLPVSLNRKPDTWSGRTTLSSSEIVSLRQDKKATIEKVRSAKR